MGPIVAIKHAKIGHQVVRLHDGYSEYPFWTLRESSGTRLGL